MTSRDVWASYRFWVMGHWFRYSVPKLPTQHSVVVLERPAQPARHRIPEAPTQPQLRSGVQNRHEVPVEPGLQLAHGRKPNDRRAVDLDEPHRVETCCHLTQGLP